MQKTNFPEGTARSASSHVLDWDTEVYLRDDYVVLDFETTNLDKGSPQNPNNRIVCAVWRCGPTHPNRNRKQSDFEQGLAHGKAGVFAHFGSEFEQLRLLEDIERASFVIAHNAKFECAWLLRCGQELRDLIVWCTQIAEYCIAGNRKLSGGLSLDSTLERYSIAGKMQYVSALIESGVCPSDIPTDLLARYCVTDVLRDESLFLQQRRRIYGMVCERLVYGRCAVTPMLADIESRGVQLDQGRVLIAHQDCFAEYNQILSELEDGFGAINWRSTKQLRELLYTRLGFEELKDRKGEPIRTPAKQPCTDEETISNLRANTPDQVEFKGLWSRLAPLKKKTQSLESMKGACEQDGGLIYAQFNQTVTGTHRLSCSGGKWGLQFQNQDRSLKRLFRAREQGWQIIDGDCPQLEFRVAGDLGNDPVARKDVLNRIDVHSFTSKILGVSRQDAKPYTFKPLYGGNSGTKREREYYRAFRKRYKAIYDTQMSWVYHVLEHKSLRIVTGLTFYWPDTEVTSSGYIINTASIFNYPVQSFATADISQLSLVLVWHKLRNMASFISNTVHDSGVLESPIEEVDKVKQIMVQSYTEDIYDVLGRLYDHNFSFPLGIGIKCGDFWGEAANEEKYENESRFQWAS
jgi:DNA polymerase I-like protein with 3'-5' exonuclease and polymerase domains